MGEELERAKAFLAKHDLRVSLKYLGDDRPEYAEDETKRPHYLVKIRRVNGPRLSYDFWDSNPKVNKGESQIPTVYNILADLGDTSSSGEDPDEIYGQFGAMKPSRALGMARFVKRVRKFFTHEELTELKQMRAGQAHEEIYA